MQFFSQVGQDEFLLENFFRGRRDGVFVDVGAYDGEKFSNSLFFERYMGWRGLCIEPMPSVFNRLQASRKAICERFCISDFEGEADFVEADAGIDEKMLSGPDGAFDPRHVERLQRMATSTVRYKVPVTTLATLLTRHALFDIDYCSMDTEGSEFRILSGLDFNRFRVALFTVEDNYNDGRLAQLMDDRGYDLVARLEQDAVFKRRDVKQLPRTTVFCAVWHGDPQRADRLREHAANVASQTVPVESVYVFDGADEPPAWLNARTVSVKESLTIYQAWNVALSLVGTRFVMNLNLDDRLAPDAVERMQQALEASDAAIVGGEWRICYSQQETDAVRPCSPADDLPFVAAWPPSPGTPTRLGSGTGDRGTLGPATMWRMDAHIGAPRYPWRMPEGTLIRSVADMLWWNLLTRQLGKREVRLPEIIGNYHSHPGDQAEFRVPYDELGLINEVGISWL